MIFQESRDSVIYKDLAPYYHDLFYDEDAIKQWVDFTLSCKDAEKILDLACGQGDIAYQLSLLGKEVLATDFSEEMQKQVQQKYPTLPFKKMDMRAIQTEEKWDQVLCFCDSVNYLTSTQELTLFFKGVKEVLKKDGQFLFDVHSVDRLDEFKEMYVEEGVINKVEYQWTMQSSGKNLHHHFAFYLENGIAEEYHTQYVFSPEEIEKSLKEAGFIWSVKTDFINDGYQRGEKYFYCCKEESK